jgi:ubiquitin conjugation factor E4 B
MQQLFMNQILLKSLSSTLTILLRKLIKSQTSLKVNNPEKYGFNAKELLRSVVTTCLHMVGGDSQGSDGVESRHSALFCAALATQYDGNDGGGIFDRATKIIRKHGILRPNDFQGKGIEMWLSLVTSVKADIQSLKADEKILGEVPDEFECPLLCTIMEDPVKLPSGKNIIFVLLLFSTIPPT